MYLVQIPLTMIIALLGKEKGKNFKNCRITEANGAEITSPHILDMTDFNFESKGPP